MNGNTRKNSGTNYLEKAIVSIKQLRGLCVKCSADNAEVHKLQAYKNGALLEQDIEQYL